MAAVAVAEKVDLNDAVVRATSDYLAVSRGRHLYSAADYDRAEADAWERLQKARAAHDAKE